MFQKEANISLKSPIYSFDDNDGDTDTQIENAKDIVFLK